MAHNFLSKAANLVTILTLTTGIAMTTLHGQSYVQASLSGQGSTVFDQPMPEDVTMRPAATIDVPAGYVRAHAAQQFVLGILLIVLGFFIHGLIRMRDEQRVHISVKPRKRQKQRVFWMELQM